MTIPGGAPSLFFTTAAGAAAGYAIDRSLRFNSADSAYLSRTPSSSSNRKTFTWSGWLKKSTITSNTTFFSAGSSGSSRSHFMFDGTNHTLRFFDLPTSTGIVTTQVFRDTSAWYHLVLSADTTQSTASNRIKIYVNGAQVTSFSSSGYPAQNADLQVNKNVEHRLGSGNTYPEYFNGYLADVQFVDGQALAATDFGETDSSGIWQPKAYEGSYGTNGFHLKFADNSTAAALGTDSSGASNTWTVNNLSVADGSISVASATGALPIYNTTDTHGTTKGSGTRSDSNSSSISLAIPMDGANNGTTFTDESATIKGSGSAKTITLYGNTKTSTTQSKFYGSSGYFDGTGDYLQSASSSDFAFGTGNFTVEFWYYHVGGTDRGLFANNSGSSVGVNFLVGAGGPFRIYNGTSANNITDFSASPSANTWQHLAIVRNSGTITLYVNGQGSGTANWSGVNAGTTATFSVGAAYGNARFAYGYIQDFRVYTGAAKYTSNFNPPNATSDPAIAAGIDSLVDTPEQRAGQTDDGVGGNVVGNYPTWNPIDNGGGVTLGNGNLQASLNTSNHKACRATIKFPESGKWYYEATITTLGNAVCIGVDTSNRTNPSLANSGTNFILVNTSNNVQRYVGSSYTSFDSAYGNPANGSILQVAYDADADKLWFGMNNVWMGSGSSANGNPGAGSEASASSITSGFPVLDLEGTSALAVNFGQRPFAYAAPSGFKCLNTGALPTPTIADGSLYFDTKLFTGAGQGSSTSVSGYSFGPDLVWTKSRAGARSHALYDTVRGNNKKLYPNTADSENSGSTITFNSDGYSLADGDDITYYGESGVGWAWDAGSSTVTNTDGSISSQVRASQTAGFSIVKYAGSGSSGTVGHSLNAAPNFIILKEIDGAENWRVHHASVEFSKTLFLNLNNAASTNSERISATSASTFTLSSGGAGVNSSSKNYLALCFAPVAGYSAMGSYTGNGSSDGPFVFTGMRPRWVLIKVTNTTDSWLLYDSARSTYNVVDDFLQPNNSEAEATGNSNALDFLSNGFKLKGSVAGTNGNNNTYIYAAFAEHPFQTARAR